MAYQKILVPLDGSELAAQALQHAQQIAKPQTKLYLLSIVEEDQAAELAQTSLLLSNAVGALSDLSAYSENIYDPNEIKNREAYLGDLAEKLQESGYQAIPVVRCGNAADTILQYAQDLQIDLIVMASHGRSGVTKLFMGSVAERVLNSSPCPILIIRGNSVA